MKGGGLDVRLPHGQAAPPGSKQPGRVRSRLCMGWPEEPWTGFRPLPKSLLPSAGLAPSLGHGGVSGTRARMLSLSRAPRGGPPWEHRDGYCRGAPGGFLLLVRWPEAIRSPSPTPSPCHSSGAAPLVCLLVNSPRCLHCSVAWEPGIPRCEHWPGSSALPWGHSRQEPATGGSGESCWPRSLADKPPRFTRWWKAMCKNGSSCIEYFI